MSNGPWPPNDDGAADPDVEWAFFGAHAIEYWVMRDGRLVPAKGSELERIAECERSREREWEARARLLRWERERRRRRGYRPGVVARCVWWCQRVARRVAPARAIEPTMSDGQGESMPHHQPGVAQRRT